MNEHAGHDLRVVVETTCEYRLTVTKEGKIERGATIAKGEWDQWLHCSTCKVHVEGPDVGADTDWDVKA